MLQSFQSCDNRVACHGISHELLITHSGIHKSLYASIYTKKRQVGYSVVGKCSYWHGIKHSIPVYFLSHGQCQPKNNARAVRSSERSSCAARTRTQAGARSENVTCSVACCLDLADNRSYADVMWPSVKVRSASFVFMAILCLRYLLTTCDCVSLSVASVSNEESLKW